MTEAPETLKEKVERRLAELGRNPFEAARKGELERGFINDILQDKKKTVRGDNLNKLAAALDWTPADLVGSSPIKQRAVLPLAGSDEIMLPIRHKVAAGPFLEVDDLPQQPYGFAPAPRIKGFEHVEQWYELVEGDSFNKKIPEGALVHVASAIDLHYEPATNDVVVVVRTRAQGALVERTLKQVEITHGGILLWPRSHSDRWLKPVAILDGTKPDEDVEVSIVGKVLRAYIGFDSPT